MEQYSKKRSLSFELEDSQEKDTGQDRLIATIHSNRQQMLEATENLLKGTDASLIDCDVKVQELSRRKMRNRRQRQRQH